MNEANRRVPTWLVVVVTILAVLVVIAMVLGLFASRSTSPGLIEAVIA